MKLFKLNKDSWKHAHWWEKQKKDWAIEDKDGVWWIIPGSEMAEKKLNEQKVKTPSRKRMRQTSMKLTPERILLIAISSILGVSLALNAVYYLLR
jgi:hypothetical protein